MSTGVTDFLPVGSVIASGGTLAIGSYWLLCDGQSYSVDTHLELFAAIGYTYGGSATTRTFNVPDYRGKFLRGTSSGTGVDPDAASRTNPGVSTDGTTLEGDAVGTSQGYATKIPGTKDPFLAWVPKLPEDTFKISGETASDAGPKGSDTMSTCTAGGDGDTRPANVYVNFYIKAKAS